MARVLIIDDDDALRGVLVKTLRNAGHEVWDAPDGQQGVDLFKATPVDIVVTDLIMPVQEGVETIVHLRRMHPQVPIIAISGGTTHSKLYLDIASKIGAKRILPKPFSPAELNHLIQQVLDEDKGRAPTPPAAP